MAVGNLVANLSLNSQPFSKGMRAARSDMGGFVGATRGGLTRVAGGFGALGAAIGAAGIAAGLVAITKSSMESIDATAKLADRLGLTTEALGGLQHAANLSGVDTSGLQSGLEKMQLKLAAAKDGSSGAQAAFGKLGLSMDELSGLGTEDSLKLIADRIMAIEDPAERARAAFQVFGKQGMTMIPMLQGGSAGLEAMSAEADKLGLTFNRVDAAKVEMANDSISKMKGVFTGLGNEMAIQTAPLITALADKFVELGTEGGGVGSVVTTGMELMAGGIGIVADVVDVLYDGFKFLQAGVTKGIAIQLSIWSKLGEGIAAVLNLFGADIEFTTLNAMAEDMHALAGSQFDDAMKSFAAPPPSEGIKGFFEDIRSDAQKAAEEIASAVGGPFETADLSEMGEQLSGLEAAAKKVFEATRNPMESFGTEMAELKELLSQGLIDQETFDRASEKARSGLVSASGFDLAAAMPEDPTAAFEADLKKLEALQDAGAINADQFAALAGTAFEQRMSALGGEKEDEGGLSGASLPEPKVAQELEAGSTAAFERIMASTMESGGDPQKLTNQKLDKQTEVIREGLRQLLTETKEVAKAQPKVASMRNGRPS